MENIKSQSTHKKINFLPSNVSETTSKKMIDANRSQLQGERCVREGKSEEAIAFFERSKTLYAQLINSDELYEVQYEAYKQWVNLSTTNYVYVFSKTQLDRVVQEYKIEKLSTKLSSYFGLDSEMNSSLQMTASMTEQHIKINVELANFYRQEALEITKPRACLSFFENILTSGRDALNYTTQEYNEAACISHLKIASQLGDTESTFALAIIFKENQFYLPYDNPKKKTTDDLAIKYAALAEMQGRKGSLCELADLFAQNSPSAETTKNIKNCYKLAIQCGDEQATQKLFLMTAREVEQNIKNVTTDFLSNG
jgi:hypothetical protein